LQLINTRPGILNSLDAKLENLEHALTVFEGRQPERMCGVIDAFIAEAEAQSGKSIPRRASAGSWWRPLSC
jgi:hypothetical protein